MKKLYTKLKHKHSLVYKPKLTTTIPHPEILQHPNIPKPLHGVNPRKMLGRSWWDTQRHIAYEKYDNHCWACGIHKKDAPYRQWLEAHESYEIDYSQGVMQLVEIVALCHSCHNFIHSGRLTRLYQTNGVSRRKFFDIMMHGFNILKSHNLKPFWGTALQWLVIKGKSMEEAITYLKAKGIMIPNDMAIFVNWGDWRLIIDDNEYEPIHKSFEEWDSFYTDEKPYG